MQLSTEAIVFWAGLLKNEYFTQVVRSSILFFIYVLYQLVCSNRFLRSCILSCWLYAIKKASSYPTQLATVIKVDILRICSYGFP